MPRDSEIILAGAGPTGLSLALGLARHGVRSTLVEKEQSTSARSKAPAIHVRTREVFRQWNVEEAFLRAGTLLQQIRLHDVADSDKPLLDLDVSALDVEVDRPGLLVLEQGETESLLLDAVRASGMCDVRFGTEAVGLAQDDEGVTLDVETGNGRQRLRGRYLVGCDGAGSFVRGALGLPFDGMTYSVRPMLADVRVDDARDTLAWPRVHSGRGGWSFTVRLAPGLWRIVRLERGPAGDDDAVPDDEVRARALELLGTRDVAIEWANRFRIHLRSSPTFRVGRVLLAGDAAHVHSPIGGMGMNSGIQDAHNLAWKLADALRGGDEDRLLDSYDVERRAIVVEDVGRYTDVMTRAFLRSPRAIRNAAFVVLRTLLRSERLRHRMLRRMTMIDLDLPPSPILDDRQRASGVRLPNLLLASPDGAVRLYDLLPAGRTLIRVGTAPELPGDGLDVARVVDIRPGAYRDQSGRLQALLDGEPGWIMVRPDAHVQWVRTRAGLRSSARQVTSRRRVRNTSPAS